MTDRKCSLILRADERLSADATTARRLPPEQRRAQLAEAALAVAAEQGYAGLSLDDVAERAGVTRNLLYHYFPRGRLDVFLAALERAGDELTGDFIVDPDQPLAERLAANTDARDRACRHARATPGSSWRHARSAAEPEIQALRDRYRDEIVTGMALNHLGTTIRRRWRAWRCAPTSTSTRPRWTSGATATSTARRCSPSSSTRSRPRSPWPRRRAA